MARRNWPCSFICTSFPENPPHPGEENAVNDFPPFASPLHLPFNHYALSRHFSMQTADRDPGGPGFLLLLRGTELLVYSRDLSLPVVVPPALLPALLQPPLFVGCWQGQPCRAALLSAQSAVPAGLRLENILASEPALPIEVLSLAGLAAQILHWQKSSAFCSVCGGKTTALSGEWGRQCGSCARSQFPPIHPCAIVLVRRPGEVLLTRKAGWPAGRYGLVAGFVDFGECLEETAVREVLEETGLQVRAPLYRGSQCWPFPSQLMAGFTADYVSGDIRIEEKELEDVRWFAVDDLPALPPRRSIARFLLDNFLSDRR
jgi:NAD+ diphosphatase